MEKLRTPGLISKDKRGYSWQRARAMHSDPSPALRQAQGPAHSKLRDRLTQSSGTGALKAQGPARSKLRDWLTHRVTCGQVDKSIPHQHAGGDAAFEGQFGFFHLHNGHRALGNHAHASPRP